MLSAADPAALVPIKEEKLKQQDESTKMDVDTVKIKQEAPSFDAGFTEMLSLFYQKLFPFKLFYKWLSYGQGKILFVYGSSPKKLF